MPARIRAAIDDLAVEMPVDTTLHLLAGRVCALLDASEALILLWQGDGLILRAACGPEGQRLQRPVPVDGTSAETWVVRHGAPLCVADIAHDQRFKDLDMSQRRNRIAALAAVPICVGDRIIGVLEVGSEQPRDFSARMDVLAAMGDVAGLVIEHTHAVRQSYAAFVEEFLRTVRHDLKSPLTAIQGYAQLLQRRARRDGHANDAQTGAIVEQTQRLVSMLDALRGVKPLESRPAEARPADPLHAHQR